MRRSIVFVAGVFAMLFAGEALAQEHWTEGPVWECGAYRTKPGQFDNYMTYLRQNFLPTTDEAKKQGLVLDRKVFTKMPARPDDWDVMICTSLSSYGKALDYNAGDEEKMKAIEAKHYKTTDEKKQQEMSAKRFEMRDFLGTTMFREVNLRPM